MKTKQFFKSCGGLIGLIVVLAICLYQLSCMAVIFYTPRGGGQGDYYDASRDVEGGGSIIGVLFLLLPLLLLFYPWIKLFCSMMLNHSRREYYGLFVGQHIAMKILSMLLLTLNIGTIIWLSFNVSEESSRIESWKYDALHGLCPDYSDVYMGYIFGIVAFWGIVHLAHGIYHHIISKKRKQS